MAATNVYSHPNAVDLAAGVDDRDKPGHDGALL
jgi:hypothetical protein